MSLKNAETVKRDVLPYVTASHWTRQEKNHELW